MRKLWISFALVLLLSFSVLGWIGTRIYQEMPPIPTAVITTTGETVIPEGAVGKGQNVWQTMGGMQLGSIWGHGSYLAPDWTADWLHRELMFVLNEWSSSDYGKTYETLDGESQARLRGRLEKMYRTNGYDAATNVIIVDPVRARAFQHCLDHYSDIFLKGHKAYAIPAGTVSSPERMKLLASFIFWTSWTASAQRPSDTVTYTNNWPHEPLIGNRPTGDNVMWTGVSIIVLLAGICAMVWWYASQQHNADHETPAELPSEDPLGSWRATPSQRATLKYFWVVSALILVQIAMGIVTAHYGVEGDGFYGIKIDDILPYSVVRTWHVQIGIFWIATAWLAAGLFIGPLVSGKDPKFQKLGVNVLFGALLLIVVGSLAGEWMSVKNRLTDDQAFLWGHQGYEYVELGRIWQILLFVGLLIWLFLVVRAIKPALKTAGDQKELIWLFLLSAGAIGLFYGAGLTWGQHSHLSIVEYWRWWVVHLWVEGVFEVFATAIVSTLFVRMGLLRTTVATTMVLFATIIFLCGGVLGTFHHLYFSGTPLAILAIGATFSALEVVPLMVVGFEAYNHARIKEQSLWESNYHWPFMFFSSVLVWNLIGAGLFGFLINPPIALYYMQGLNTTANHGHAALFGVYGMLGLGLMLYCMRGLTDLRHWNQRYLKVAFWSMNIGLAMMTFLSLLPQGLWQTYASISHYYAYARSAEFMHSTVMEGFVWARVPGDILFAVGAASFGLFVWQAFWPPGKNKVMVKI